MALAVWVVGGTSGKIRSLYLNYLRPGMKLGEGRQGEERVVYMYNNKLGRTCVCSGSWQYLYRDFLQSLR